MGERPTIQKQTQQISFAVLDSGSLITAVSDVWRSTARSNGLHLPNAGIGAHYLSFCADGEQRTAIRSVMSGKRSLVAFHYPCHTPKEKRWFVVVGVHRGDPASGAILFHIDISDGALGAIELAVGLANSSKEAISEAISDAWSKSLKRDALAPDLAALTPRQLAVLRLIANGRSNDEIAVELGCELTTIKQHVSAILRRLAVSSRTQAALYWRQHHDLI